MTTLSTTATFWDKVAAKYAKQPIGNVANYEQTMADTRRYLPGDADVLEIGAGTSSTAMLLAPAVGSYVATDVSSEMVAIGQEKAWNGGVSNLSVQQGAAEDGTLPAGPFDAVLAFNLLHLVRDPFATASAARDRLRPGGVFISKSACIAPRHLYLWPMIQIARLFGKAPYLNTFSAKGLRRQIEDAGFEILETHTYKVFPTAEFIVARRI